MYLLPRCPISSTLVLVPHDLLVAVIANTAMRTPSTPLPVDTGRPPAASHLRIGTTARLRSEHPHHRHQSRTPPHSAAHRPCPASAPQPTAPPPAALTWRSDYYAVPIAIRRRDLLDLDRPTDQTPADYQHGPRERYQSGPLIAYPEHAREMQRRLANVQMERRALREGWEGAVRELRKAEGELGDWLAKRGAVAAGKVANKGDCAWGRGMWELQARKRVAESRVEGWREEARRERVEVE